MQIHAELHVLTTTPLFRYSLVRTFQLIFGEDMSKLSCLADLYSRIKDNAKLCERLETLPVVLQVHLLLLNSIKHEFSNQY